jgi:hypothetical protein
MPLTVSRRLFIPSLPDGGDDVVTEFPRNDPITDGTLPGIHLPIAGLHVDKLDPTDVPTRSDRRRPLTANHKGFR